MKRTFSPLMAGLATAALVVSLPLAALAQAPATSPAPVDHSKMTPEQMRQHGPVPPAEAPAPVDHSKMTPEQMKQHGPLPAEKAPDKMQMTPEQMLEQTPEAAPPAPAPAPAKKKP